MRTDKFGQKLHSFLKFLIEFPGLIKTFVHVHNNHGSFIKSKYSL